MDVTKFVKLSTSVCNDLRSWVEQARHYAVLTEEQLLTLSDAADVIDRATITLTANRPNAASYVGTELTDGERTLAERVADAADEAGSAWLPRDKVLSNPKPEE